MVPTIPTRLLYQGAAGSPIGGLRLAGYLRTSRGLPRHPMRVLGSYALVYLLDGEGSYSDAGRPDQPVRAGDLLLIFPDIPHTYGPAAGEQWAEFYLVFDGPVFNLWRKARLLDPQQPVLHLQPVNYWLRRLESIIGDSRHPSPGESLAQACRMQQLLAEVLAHARKAGTPAEDVRWIDSARAQLERLDSAESPEWDAIAGNMGISYEGFRKKFTRLAGVSPGRYHAERVVARACQLMQQRPLTNRQLAEQLGFCDEFHFSRRFKQVLGIAPHQFRRQLTRG